MHINSLHLSMTMHESVPELSNILLSLVSLREPEHLSTAVEEPSTEPPLVQYSSALVGELPTVGEGEREGRIVCVHVCMCV